MTRDMRQVWQDLEKAISLVGAASEADGMPDNLRDELLNALGALVWVSQSLRCPACGSWRVQESRTTAGKPTPGESA
jgi:hypothetical protein